MFPGWIAFVIFMSHASAPAAATMEIEIVADSSLDSFPRTLTLVADCTQASSGSPPIRRTFSGNRFAVSGLQSGCYEAGLEIQGERRVELGFPAVRPVRFDFRKFRVHGRVTRGGEGKAARLLFTVKDLGQSAKLASTPALAESEVSGEYETWLWPGALYSVRIEPKESGSPVSRFSFSLEEAADREKDFALSANTLKITIRDAKTRDPIPGVRLAYVDSNGSQHPQADSTGELTLESVPSGPFHATAVARGYVNAAVDWAIEDRDEAQAFEVSMNPKTEGNDFQVFLPDGSPAANAFAFSRYDAITDSRVLIPCDSEGMCHPGERPSDSDLIFLKHPDAGLTILSAATLYASRTAVMSPAGGDLVIRLRAGPKSKGGCESATAELQGIPIGRYQASGSQFVCGEKPEPLTLAGFPAGTLSVSIVLLNYDDHSRPTPVRIAGPIAVSLPSAPIEVELP